MESKMKGFKTVTYDGQIYQIGKAYLVDGGGGNWVLIVLRAIALNSSLPFRCSLMGYRACKNAPADSVGTITPAPIELVNGAAYMFDCDTDVSVMGIFCKRGGLFLINDGACFNACFCTNIRPMAVVEGVKS